nr:outer membrane beta-barrel family protein [Prevotella sp. KH2C16]
MNADYVHNKNDYYQNTTEYHADRAPVETYSKGNGQQDLFAVKLDWTLKLSPKATIVWGTEANYTSSKGNLTISSIDKASTNYKTEENIYAAFMELRQLFNGLTLFGGVRYEDYTYKYSSLNAGSEIRKHYRHLFPSLKASFTNGSWNHTLVFSSQINCPTFRQMSNASYYGNEYMYQQGNPKLVPDRLYSLQLYSSYKFIMLSMEYTYQKDYIALSFYNNGKDNIIVSTYRNYPAIRKLNFYLNMQKKLGIWSPSLSVGISQPFFKYDYRGEEINHNKASVYAVFNQHFQLPHNYLLSSYIYYNTGGNQGAVSLRPFHSIDIGLQKSFLSDRFIISLQAKDIFHGMKFREKELVDAFHFTQTEDYHLWNFSVNITYRINSRKTKYRGKNSLEKDIKRL